MPTDSENTRRDILHLIGLGAGTLAASPLLAACGKTAAIADAGTTVDASGSCKDFWLCGNHAPVGEAEAFDLAVEGSLPPSLLGTYLRNGPNPQSGSSNHWFAGDGMVHAIRLENGKASWYRSRYVKTAVLGKPPLMGPPNLSQHPANTSILFHNGRTYALAEAGIPYEISKDDLSTVGTNNYGGKLTGAMTAHPKIDPQTGELLFFGAAVGAARLDYWEISAGGEITRSEKIELPESILSHDFQITPSHAIFLDVPLVFNLELAIQTGGLGYEWRPQNGARIGVLPRGTGGNSVQWFDIEECYIFHTVNAFHDPADSNQIHLDVVRYPKMWVNGPTDFGYPGRLTRYTLNLTTGTVNQQVLNQRTIEFPVIDKRRQGQAHQFGYAIADPQNSVGGSPEIMKFDFNRGVATTHVLGGNLLTGELTFVPESNRAGEDDGWLLSYAYHPPSQGGRLLVFDATNIGKGPVASVTLPQRVPYGFHGTFIPA